MKLNGKKIEGPNVTTIVIPRGDSQIVFRAQAIMDMEEFDKLCPQPKPPTKIVKGGLRVPNMEDDVFKAQIQEYAKRRTAYMILKSLQATPGLEWEMAKIGDPSTWLLYEQELKGSGFSETEINIIAGGVAEANCLSDDKIEEARNRFLAGEREAEARSSQAADPSSTASGAPASASS